MKAFRIFAAFGISAALTGAIASGAAFAASPPVLKAGMTLAEARAALRTAGWFPPDAPYCQVGKIESETGYCGLMPASLMAVAPEARAATTDHPAIQMCYRDHHGTGLRVLFTFQYGAGHEEPPPSSLKLSSWDMVTKNCVSQ
jgi:hypothetical protein